MVDYEQEEQFEEQATEPQAEDMEIDEDDAPYLDLRVHRWNHRPTPMTMSSPIGSLPPLS